MDRAVIGAVGATVTEPLLTVKEVARNPERLGEASTPASRSAPTPARIANSR